MDKKDKSKSNNKKSNENKKKINQVSNGIGRIRSKITNGINNLKSINVKEIISNEVKKKTDWAIGVVNNIKSINIKEIAFNFRKQTIWDILKYIVISFIVVLVVTLISPTSDDSNVKMLAYNLLRNTMSFYIIGSIFLLFKNGIVFFYLYSFIWVIIGLANNIVFEVRGTSLTKHDFLMIKEGIELGKEFLSNSDLIKIMLLVVVAIGIFIFTIKKINKSKKLYLSSWLITLGLSFGVLNIVPVMAIGHGVEDIGFVDYFLNNMFSGQIKKVRDYTEKNIKEIKNKIDLVDDIENDVKPNIVAVQLESFFDPKTLEGLELSENPIPYFDELRKKYSSGYVNVPTFGGGTARSEFEFLTSIDLESFSEGIIPHNTFLKENIVSSIPHKLRETGYTTHLLHNYFGYYYDRNKIYRGLGFDSFTSKEFINNSSFEQMPIKASNDAVFVEEVKNILNKEKDSTFVFAITAGLHGPYDVDYKASDNEIEVSGDFSKSMLNGMTEYVNRIGKLDTMIKDMVKELEELDEPTIAIFYSDHLPSFKFNSTNLKKEKYNAPYLVWDNIGLEKEDKDIELSDLMLDQLVKSNVCIGNLTKLYRGYSDTEEYKRHKNLLNHDISFGENYIGETKFEENKNMKIGYRDMKISEAKRVSEGKYVIKGENFTEYTRLMWNDLEFLVDYINEGEIVLNTAHNLVREEVYLKIGIGTDNADVNKSKTFVIEDEVKSEIEE